MTNATICLALALAAAALSAYCFSSGLNVYGWINAASSVVGLVTAVLYWATEES